VPYTPVDAPLISRGPAKMHASKKGPNSRAQQGSAKQAKANRGIMIVQALETIPVADLKKLFLFTNEEFLCFSMLS